ncbi:NACHT domain-containing protein [Fusarium falciforme]|uniref:NACHT domain-containing protein n=1 Tax=Fusarium falciforme TaxID=195108 RepID=UPI002301889E|nr:NACHT domain-containing protein [Fusarium falciforme]WAO82927.1 NACHT domain-containing protein [Fusarium falciforme]
MSLKAPSAAQSAGRETIKRAFKDLERAICPADSRDFTSTTIGDVRRASIEIERQLAARQSLRNMRRLEALFLGLEHYSKVIEVLCNGTDYLPWIWAPIKLILKISSDYVHAFERLIKAYSQIADSLRRFQLLEQSFQDKPQLYPTFAIFYADILQFHKAAYKFVTRRCWKTLFATSWGRFERKFDNILDDLKRHAALIDKEVNAHNILEAREMRKELESWKAESLERLAREEREQTARQVQGLITWLRLDDSDQIILQDSLSSVSVNSPGTVDWVLKKPEVAAWLRPTPDTPFLWLQGGPGTAKSVITAGLLRFLDSQNNPLVVRHFCSYSRSSSTLYDQIIKALLLQTVRGDGDLVTHIYEEYVGSKQATLPLLEKLLETSVEVLSGGNKDQNPVYIVLDGLDECPHDKQRRLVRMMDRLVANGNTCKVLISSRDTVPLLEKLKRRPCVSLSEDKANLIVAITKFADMRLQVMRNKLMELGISEGGLQGIATQIGVKSDGMFLWACLVLNYLAANFFYSEDEFKNAVDSLPRELSEFYDKILSRILSDLDSRSALRLRTMFGWIAFAKRPLRKAELQSALLFHSEDPIGSRPIPSYILEVCKPLVEERRNSTLSFIHGSVKDYLQSETCQRSVRISEQAILWENGLASLRCLRTAFNVFNRHFSQSSRNLQLLRGVWGFIPYASRFWCVGLREMVSFPIEDWDPRFEEIAAQISAALATSRPGHDDHASGPTVKELEKIRCFSSLWYDATIGLRAHAERRLLPGDSELGGTLMNPTHIHNISENYEITIQQLMSIREHSDLTPSELEQFRDNFGGHAYPCRFPSCTYAIKGFGDNNERVAHEIEHTPRFPCVEPGCQYPPFGSSRALKRHQSDCHGKRKRKLRVKAALPNMGERREMDSRLTRSGTHEVGHNMPFHCDVQGCYRKEGFNTMYELDSHKRFVHKDSQGVGGMPVAVQGATQQPEYPAVGPPLFSPKTEDWQSVDMQSVPSNNPFLESSPVSTSQAPSQPSNSSNAPVLHHLRPAQQQIFKQEQQLQRYNTPQEIAVMRQQQLLQDQQLALQQQRYRQQEQKYRQQEQQVLQLHLLLLQQQQQGQRQ